ncbi:hypothetical protein HN858_01910 [Candidatus Falkowbacteria bacterium]|jgi:hypothetical protein|nr:hypothetical protein [Candidatus Falkowbacteria bacterium]MBT5503565.1 hypothetical protein [Candidatus Falkowbacteria bacterium]MBT6573602.1 hypothetical protein [Candidatus Falkowbacteria bacterium]MBT7348410.1 hypothetical protein [Candidatus Falkowbacteria bacterium]MBT7500636.1 hypothetical protein [Candidatus Falkowbacteria bacterium]
MDAPKKIQYMDQDELLDYAASLIETGVDHFQPEIKIACARLADSTLRLAELRRKFDQ